VRAGRTAIYLLDTNLDENDPIHRQLSTRLYVADMELRIKEEIILGIGGVRVLRALGINPSVWHANEGHTAFMMLERIREQVEKGAALSVAVGNVRATTVFTTHTPVPAGNDTFDKSLVERYFNGYWELLGLDQESFIRLGQQNSRTEDQFNMTVLALRLAERRNGVSALHSAVSRKMWHVLWPETKEDEVPITGITNGVHVPTWIAREMDDLYKKYLGQDWMENHDDARLWDRVLDIPDEELWTVHHTLKRKLVNAINERVQRGWAEGRLTLEQLPAMGALLHPGMLTIGFVRRFAEYKRPYLLFEDVERLRRMVTGMRQPIQIIFAGKSHPADFPSKHLLHSVYSMAKDRSFVGRIAFIEDHDIQIARYLVQGVDVWLNTPRRLKEACGTSGMKAALNGIPHLSVRDGWWHEAYIKGNGWAIGDGIDLDHPVEEDKADSEALYRLLEGEIIPLYYSLDHKGVSHGWVRLMKEAVRSIVPHYCARRMLKEYTERMYIPAARLIERKEKAV
jgi:starch phosphorylase